MVFSKEKILAFEVRSTIEVNCTKMQSQNFFVLSSLKKIIVIFWICDDIIRRFQPDYV